MTLFIRLRNAWLLYRAAVKDKRTPALAKILPLLALLYLLWPLDFIPDSIPFFGQMDDLGVIIFFCWLALRMIPKEVKDDFRRRIIAIGPK